MNTPPTTEPPPLPDPQVGNLPEYLQALDAWLAPQRRYLLCHPSKETFVKAALGLSFSRAAGLYEVLPDPACPVDRVFSVPRDLPRYPLGDTPYADLGPPRRARDYPPGSGTYLPDGLLRSLNQYADQPVCAMCLRPPTVERYYLTENRFHPVCEDHKATPPT